MGVKTKKVNKAEQAFLRAESKTESPLKKRLRRYSMTSQMHAHSAGQERGKGVGICPMQVQVQVRRRSLPLRLVASCHLEP